MANINPRQAASVLIEHKGKLQAFEYIYSHLKQCDETGEMHSYHDWANVLRAYASLVVKHTATIH